MEARLEKVRERLIQNGIINKDDRLSFIPSQGSFLRKDFKEVSKYRIDINGISKFILRIASDLKWLEDKYNKLLGNKDLFPAIVLSFRENEKDFLLEEFINGETVEKVICKNPRNKNEVIAKVIQLHEELNENLINSDFEHACEEMEQLIDVFVGLNFVTELDSVIINSAVRPEILKLLAKKGSFRKRFTQGDFIDRNILLTDDGNLKIIDLEFAHETHFYGEEIIRFYKYSSSLADTNLQNEAFDKVDEIYFNLNQMRLIWESHKEFIAPPSFDHLVDQVMRILRNESDSFAYSRIVKLLVGDLTAKYVVLQGEYASIMNSISWIVGRFITMPFRKIFSLFGK